MSNWNLGRLLGRTPAPRVRFKPADQNVEARKKLTFTFDADKVGEVPPGAEVFSGEWQVRKETDAPTPPNALCQIGQARFPAIALTDAVYADVSVLVQFKPISGRQDQAGGIIFRVQDKDNYYILRANALENNVNFYKYVGGQRHALKRARASVPTGLWQALRVEVRGNRMQGYLNNMLVVETTDDTFAAGRVGLWTKADSVTCFADVQITPL